MRLAETPLIRAGVIGWPIAHSRSPRLHGTWLKRYGIHGEYNLIPVEPGTLPTALADLQAQGYAGANVTIPHKETVLRLCHALSPAARRIKAANTLIFRDGKIFGDNTDGYGFLANLRAHGVTPGGPALILGAGGAARAIGAALTDAGIPVTFTNRTPERAEILAADFSPADTLPWDQREAALKDHAILINTTALGMQHQPELEMSLAAASPGLIVSDIVYAPLQTTLLRNAAAAGLKAVEGLGMLLHQAVPGFEAWFGLTPVVDEELYRIVSA